MERVRKREKCVFDFIKVKTRSATVEIEKEEVIFWFRCFLR
jgi:hypothetical protein